MKKRIVFVLALCAMAFFFAMPAKASAYEYTITSYDVNVKVDQSNILHITEDLTVDFAVNKHGIYRTIPMTNHVKRQDGSQSTVHAKVSNVSCSDTFSTSYDNGDYKIKIGDKDRYINGEHHYKITYDYDLGNDKLDNADEFYYNLIGTGWTDTSISDVKFHITMPKDFDYQKIGCSYGREGSTKHEEVMLSVNGRQIDGYLDMDVVLGPKEGLTVRITLPEGYFLKRATDWKWQYVTIAIAIAGAILGFILWLIFGHDDPVIETVEFHAPEGKNSLDIAFLHKGEASRQDVVSLLIYLANKGYLRIEEKEEQGLFKKTKSFVIIKEKEYDGNSATERIFLSGLFASSDCVTKEALTNRFYKTVNSIIKIENSKENRRAIFNANSLNKGWVLVLISILTMALATILPMLEYGNDLTMTLMGLIFPLIGTFVMIQMILSKGISAKIFGIIWGMGFGGMPFIMMVWPIISSENRFIVTYIISIVCVIIMIIFMKLMSKRTPYGTEILGRTRGFKHFIEVAERDRLEALVEEDPAYFYEIMPYAYVFGLSDKWIKNFETIVVEPPHWYGGYGAYGFRMSEFNRFMDSTMSSANTAMTSSPSSSSGGGSSGGGSGGGGGGSW